MLRWLVGLSLCQCAFADIDLALVCTNPDVKSGSPVTSCKGQERFKRPELNDLVRTGPIPAQLPDQGDPVYSDVPLGDNWTWRRFGALSGTAPVEICRGNIPVNAILPETKSPCKSYEAVPKKSVEYIVSGPGVVQLSWPAPTKTVGGDTISSPLAYYIFAGPVNHTKMRVATVAGKTELRLGNQPIGRMCYEVVAVLTVLQPMEDDAGKPIEPYEDTFESLPSPEACKTVDFAPPTDGGIE